MGVKLRVRVDGASHRIEVPEVCTLGQLRAAVASKVLADAWPASAVGLSLNGDASADLGDATGASESATLRACGVARGDLIHVHRRGAPAPTDATARRVVVASDDPSPSDDDAQPRSRARALALAAAERRAALATAGVERPDPSACAPMDVADASPRDPDPSDPSDPSDPAAAAAAAAASDFVLPPFTLPPSLARVLAAESARDPAPLSPTELAVALAHAAMREAGFVLRGAALGDRSADPSLDAFDGLRSTNPRGWRDDAATRGRFGGEYVLAAAPHAATVAVRAQAVGPHRVVLAGALSNDGEKEEPDGIRTRRRPTRRADVDASALAALAEYFPSRIGASEAKAAGGGASREALPARFSPELFRSAWHAAKDRLATPLRRDACEFAGLPPPPALLSLPEELKALAFAVRLDARDLCAVASTCRELRSAADSNDAWRPAFERAFGAEEAAAAAAAAAAADDAGGPSSSGGPSSAGGPSSGVGGVSFKRLFRARVAEARRRAAALEQAARLSRRPPPPGIVPGIPAPGVPPGGMFPGIPGYVPGITGGDYDLYPGGFAGGSGGSGGFGGLGGRAIMPGFPGGGRVPRTPGGAFGGGFGGASPFPLPGGMPGGLPTPGGADPTQGPLRPGGRGRGGPPRPGWDGRPRNPFGDGDGDGLL